MSMIRGINQFTANRLAGHGYRLTELSTGEIRVTRDGRLVASRAGRWSLEEWARKLERKIGALREAVARCEREHPRKWRAAMKKSMAERGRAVEIPHCATAEICLGEMATESVASVSDTKIENTFVGDDDGRAWCVVLVMKLTPAPEPKSNVIPFRRRA
jgi:hypothetical protein